MTPLVPIPASVVTMLEPPTMAPAWTPCALTSTAPEKPGPATNVSVAGMGRVLAS